MNEDARRQVPEGMNFSPWPARDGWPLRRFGRDPAGNPRGSLLFLGGRGDFAEKYLEALDHWHGAGWRLDGFDWRGQGGSGRLLADRLVCHLDSFDPLVDDLEAFIGDWRARTPGPHVAIAHSMGAHVLLRCLAERDLRLEAAVLLAPMAGIRTRPLPGAAARLLVGGAVVAGFGERRLWQGDIGNIVGRMTSCADRQADKIWWKSTFPEIASGAPSWGWLRAALASIRRLARAPRLAADMPVLMLASRGDPVIDLDAVTALARRLPGAELEILEGNGHELLREADRFRLPAIARIDDFLGRVVSGPG